MHDGYYWPTELSLRNIYDVLIVANSCTKTCVVYHAHDASNHDHTNIDYKLHNGLNFVDCRMNALEKSSSK